MDGNIDLVSKPGDVLIGSPGDVHRLWNKTKEEFRLVVFKINLPEGGKRVAGTSV
jgi:quercetin dioxygenase-like cupin family protein